MQEQKKTCCRKRFQSELCFARITRHVESDFVHPQQLWSGLFDLEIDFIFTIFLAFSLPVEILVNYGDTLLIYSSSLS